MEFNQKNNPEKIEDKIQDPKLDGVSGGYGLYMDKKIHGKAKTAKMPFAPKSAGHLSPKAQTGVSKSEKGYINDIDFKF